ncbi:hypothetical protein [Glycomyces paridis]|uniref:Uncharacterized protein n=1 Tax=Glycomyces paridis TaxID=2126555 RepID=A0A4S8PJA3_9ACTN|nr:hypothetical protein [Glycomyces paridis]THV30768.1 hypothetical protein E9998_05135 [Glycomyces paridis]
MTALTQRKYRFAAHLATDAARTLGLWTVAGFAVLLAASAIYRAAVGAYADFAVWALLVIPAAMLAAGWLHLHKAYPRAIANGLTRKELIAAFALYGAVAVLAAAALTQAGNAVIGLFSTFRGVEHHTGFYGLGWFDSVARPALWFAVGAAAGSAMIRFGRRWLGALVSALFISVAVYRSAVISLAVNLGQQVPDGDGTLIEIPLAVDENTLAWIDLALAAAVALAALALLARAPMRPKPA